MRAIPRWSCTCARRSPRPWPRRSAKARLDFAFLALPGRRNPGLDLTPLGYEVMPLGVHSGHRLAGRADVELAALADETFADGPPNWGTRVAVDRAFAAAGVERR